MLYCIHPSAASVQATGATAPQYTQCVSNPVSLPFSLSNPESVVIPEGCIDMVFEFNQFDPYLWQCYMVDAQKKSWGSLKAAY